MTKFAESGIEVELCNFYGVFMTVTIMSYFGHRVVTLLS